MKLINDSAKESTTASVRRNPMDLEYEKPHNNSSPLCRGLTVSEKFLLKASLIVGGGGFIFGYNIGVMSGALAQLEEQFSLSDVEAGLAMSSLALGSILGCVAGGPLCDSLLGRWKTIQLLNVIFLIGAIVSATATSFAAVTVGRFITGIASSLSSIADIPYLQEVAPPAVRGRISSSYEILVVVGIFTSFIFNILLTDAKPESGWRYMFIAPAPLLVLQILGMFFLPESPKYLIDTGHIEEAKRVLRITLDNRVAAAAAGRRGGEDDEDEEVGDRVEELLDAMVTDVQVLDSSRHCVGGDSDSDNDYNNQRGTLVSATSLKSGDKHLDNNHFSDDSIWEDTSVEEIEHSIPQKKKNIILRQVERLSRKGSVKSSYAKLDQSRSTPTGEDNDVLVLSVKNWSTIKPFKTNFNKKGSTSLLCDFEAFREYKVPLLVIITLMFFQQFTGGVVVRNYAPKIFNSAGFGYRQSLLFNLALGGVKVLSTMTSIYFVDTLGRKPLLLIGISISCVGMLVLTIGFACGLESNIGIFLCAGILITLGYSAGFGPVCWVIQSEYFPTTIRGRCMAVSVFISNIVVAVGSTGVFCGFLVISLLALLFVSKCIVETKHKQPKEILEALRAVNSTLL